VDSHTHLISAPPRVLQYRMAGEDLGGHGPISVAGDLNAVLQYVRNTPAGTLEFQAKKYIEAGLRHGTTTVEAKTGYGLNASGEMKMLRVLSALRDSCASVVPTFLGAHAVPPEYTGNSQEYINWLCHDLMPRVRERRLARFVDVLCDPGGFTLQEARQYLDAARRLGLAIKVHAEETARTGAVRLALDFEAASADGLNHVDENDADLLGRSRTVCTLMPGGVHQGAYSRFPPARTLIDRGAAVALATGFHPSVNSTFSMQSVISLACTQMQMTAEEAISAATINGAHALGLSRTCGSLEFGKQADLLFLSVSDYREIPFHFGGNIVAIAMRKGEIVYREGAVTCSGV
jgi:imidazolonepropionase